MFTQRRDSRAETPIDELEYLMRKALCLASLISTLAPAAANSEVFQINRNYLCATQTAYYAAPQISAYGEWTEPPTRFQIRILACEVYCLPQKSKEPPLSLHVMDSGQDWGQKFEGYRGRASFHSLNGGAVTVSPTNLSLTRMMIGSLPGAENQVSFVLSATCHPIDEEPS